MRELHEARGHDSACSRLRGPVGLRAQADRYEQGSSYLEAIREALVEEMRRDPKVFVLGEDVGAYGGAFGATQGLYDEFGEMRVVDTPISESAIIGVSIGAALRGYRPVAEMQFADFISLRLRSDRQPGGDAAVPLRRPRVGADRRARAERRQRRRRPVSLAESGGLVHPPARPEGGRAVDGLRRQRAAQGGDPRRQPGDLLRAQVSVSPRQGPGARRRRDRADRRRRDPACRRATSRC